MAPTDVQQGKLIYLNLWKKIPVTFPLFYLRRAELAASDQAREH